MKEKFIEVSMKTIICVSSGFKKKFHNSSKHRIPARIDVVPLFRSVALLGWGEYSSHGNTIVG